MSRFEPLLLLVWTAVAAGLVFGGFEGPVRIGVSLAFLAMAPGWAVLRMARIGDITARLLLVVPLSLGIDAITAGVLVYAGVPSWDLGLTIIASVVIAAVILDLVRPHIVLPTERDWGTTGKLSDEQRQARVLDALLAGHSLADAADAAGISRTTLVRAMSRSDALRRSVEIASGQPPPDDAAARRKQQARPARRS